MNTSLCEAFDAYVVIHDGLAVFESCESWRLLRRLKEGDTLEAAGEAQDVQGFKMLPIFPTGAVEMRGLGTRSEDTRTPILLNPCLFGSSEGAGAPSSKDVSECCHVEGSLLLRLAEDFVDIDDEFSYVAVKNDDFTFCRDATAPLADQSCPQAYSPHTVEPSSDAQSLTPLKLEGKVEGRDASIQQLVVKNTFLDIRIDSGEKVDPEWKSCPTVIMTNEFLTKYRAMEEAHIRGDCRPCAYFLTKADGCQNGGGCSFCHLCPFSALKQKKKEKVKALKQRDYQERLSRARGLRANCNS